MVGTSGAIVDAAGARGVRPVSLEARGGDAAPVEGDRVGNVAGDATGEGEAVVGASLCGTLAGAAGGGSECVDGTVVTGAGVLGATATVLHAPSASAHAITIAVSRVAKAGLVMWMLALEAVIALALLIFIVWWTTSSPRRPERPDPPRDDRR